MPRNTNQPESEGCASTLHQKFGERGVVFHDAQKKKYEAEWRESYAGTAQAILTPRSTAEVSEMIAICNTYRAPVIPQGGNTGLVGGQTPDDTGTQYILSTEKLTAIRKVDERNLSITMEAGVTLKAVQETAEDVELFFPLSLASENACTVGGNLATKQAAHRL